MVCPRPVLAVVADRVLAGETLLTWLPRDTHDDLYSIMRPTWSRDPRQRPLMSEVLSRLQDLEAKLLQVGHLTSVFVVGLLAVGYRYIFCVGRCCGDGGVGIVALRVCVGRCCLQESMFKGFVCAL